MKDKISEFFESGVGLPLLRVYGAGAGTMSGVRIEVHQRV